jgi:hypothetical protein
VSLVAFVERLRTSLDFVWVWVSVSIGEGGLRGVFALTGSYEEPVVMCSYDELRIALLLFD